MNPRTDSSFPILLWGAPPPEETTLQRYREIAAGGFTGVITWFNDIPFHRRLLDICRSAGLKAWLGDFRLLTPRDAPRGRFRHNLDELIRDHRQHPALGGYYLQNHPRVSDFSHLADVTRYLRKHDPEHRPFINVPSHFPGLSRFLHMVRPPILSWDQPLVQRDPERSRYFRNLETMCSISLKTGIRMWPTLFCGGFGKSREPEEVELRWQVSVNLCFGVKGFSWIPYWTPGPSRRWHGDALISAEGQRAPHYETVSRLNRKVQNLGPTLLRLHSKGVFQGRGRPLAHRCPVREIRGDETLMGWFQDARKVDHLLVVNGSMRTSSCSRLMLQPSIRSVAEVSQMTGRMHPVTVVDGILETELQPGEGRLFRL